jgi:hypothetical protein
VVIKRLDIIITRLPVKVAKVRIKFKLNWDLITHWRDEMLGMWKYSYFFKCDKQNRGGLDMRDQGHENKM